MKRTYKPISPYRIELEKSRALARADGAIQRRRDQLSRKLAAAKEAHSASPVGGQPALPTRVSRVVRLLACMLLWALGGASAVPTDWQLGMGAGAVLGFALSSLVDQGACALLSHLDGLHAPSPRWWMSSAISLACVAVAAGIGTAAASAQPWDSAIPVVLLGCAAGVLLLTPLIVAVRHHHAQLALVRRRERLHRLVEHAQDEMRRFVEIEIPEIRAAAVERGEALSALTARLFDGLSADEAAATPGDSPKVATARDGDRAGAPSNGSPPWQR